MRKLFILAMLLASICTSAQTLDGDMDHDGELTIVDITMLINAYLNYDKVSESENYEELKKKESEIISGFIANNHFVGPISVISESQFIAQDSVTNTEQNQFVLFEDDGVYMQIVRKGSGKSMAEMAKEQSDSVISKTILCRFLEYNIMKGDTTCTNLYSSGIVDKMLCKYSYGEHRYEAAFTEGYMRATYPSTTAVPKGWLKPFDYVRLSKTSGAGEIAKVRLIVPHNSGTTTASSLVLPFYYEITYMLGK